MPDTPTETQISRFLADCNLRRHGWAGVQKSARQSTERMVRTLTDHGHTDTCLEEISVLDQAGKAIESNGYYRYFLWDTRQATAGVPLHLCRVSIIGALGIALYGNPRYATGPRMHAIEQLLVDRVTAPSLAAWADYPGNGQAQALELLRDTVDALRRDLS